MSIRQIRSEERRRQQQQRRPPQKARMAHLHTQLAALDERLERKLQFRDDALNKERRRHAKAMQEIAAAFDATLTPLLAERERLLGLMEATARGEA